jgi:hypothetical protein
MGNLFVKEKLVDLYIVAIDSTLLRAKGHLWHKSSSMIKGVVPRSGIDIDARWEFSHSKGLVFGYKLYIPSSTVYLIVPLSAAVDFTQADVQDNNQINSTITSSLPQGERFIAGNSRYYNDYKLYNLK